MNIKWIALAFSSCLIALAVSSPAFAAKVKKKDGQVLSGTINTMVVQKATVRHTVGSKHFFHIVYWLTRGADTIEIDEAGIHSRGNAYAVFIASETGSVPPSDAEVIKSALANRRGIEFTGIKGPAVDIVIIPPPKSREVLINSNLLIGEVRETSAGAVLDPAITLVTTDGGARVPIEDIAEFTLATSTAKSPAAKIRKDTSLTFNQYKITAIQMENTGRRSIESNDIRGGDEVSIAIGDDLPGVVWKILCNIESTGGIGFNLALLYLDFLVYDESGRVFTPIIKDAHGFDSKLGGGFVTFLAVGPKDSKRIFFRFGDSISEIQIR